MTEKAGNTVFVLDGGQFWCFPGTGYVKLKSQSSEFLILQPMAVSW